MKLKSRKKGTLIIKGLLANRVRVTQKPRKGLCRGLYRGYTVLLLKGMESRMTQRALGIYGDYALQRVRGIWAPDFGCYWGMGRALQHWKGCV